MTWFSEVYFFRSCGSAPEIASRSSAPMHPTATRFWHVMCENEAMTRHTFATYVSRKCTPPPNALQIGREQHAVERCGTKLASTATPAPQNPSQTLSSAPNASKNTMSTISTTGMQQLSSNVSSPRMTITPRMSRRHRRTHRPLKENPYPVTTRIAATTILRFPSEKRVATPATMTIADV